MKSIVKAVPAGQLTAEEAEDQKKDPAIRAKEIHEWQRRSLLDPESGVGKEGRRFYELIHLLGWSLGWRGCGFWSLVQPNGVETRYALYGRDYARIEADRDSGMGIMMGFRLRDCEMKMLDGACLSVSAKDSQAVYLLIPNYDLTKEQRRGVLRAWKGLERRWARAEQRAREEGVIP